MSPGVSSGCRRTLPSSMPSTIMIWDELQRGSGKTCFHVARYPVGRASQSALHFAWIVGWIGICLVSDTDIGATTNQRWPSDGPLANPHVFRAAIASQRRRSLCSSSFRMIFWLSRSYVCRVNAVPILSAFDHRHLMGWQNWPCKPTLNELIPNTSGAVRTTRRWLHSGEWQDPVLSPECYCSDGDVVACGNGDALAGFVEPPLLHR